MKPSDLVENQSDRTYQWEGLVFNLLCGVYFLTLGPVVTNAAYSAIHAEAWNSVWLGFIIIAIILLEIYAFPKKMRYVRHAARAHGDDLGTGFWMWMFHAVISIILLFTMAGCFGVTITEGSEADLPWWLMVAIPVTVIKELGFMMCLLVGKDDEEDNAEEREKYKRPNRKEWVLDLILIFYACIGYSATWAALTKNMAMERDNTVMFVVNIFVSFLLFLIFYIPLRIPYWLEEIARMKTKRDFLLLFGSILIAYLPTIWSLR
ncbi:MAG: hypothetical protein CMO55_01170 [Verrucomicrobiales bacterium]|nr:hypothetical protein [Verrucomicrobiales bacterium]